MEERTTTLVLPPTQNESYRFIGWTGVPQREGITAEGNKLAPLGASDKYFADGGYRHSRVPGQDEILAENDGYGERPKSYETAFCKSPKTALFRLTNVNAYDILKRNGDEPRLGAAPRKFNKDAMNGINLTKIFQRAAGRCEAVYVVKCLTREQKPLSGYVVFL